VSLQEGVQEYQRFEQVKGTVEEVIQLT
jgi:hypothetical protein